MTTLEVQGSAISIGAENFSKTGEGAFTGEVSVGQIADFGIEWVLVGHSERRSLYGETDDDTAEKVAMGLSKGLNVMLCIGEQLSERENGTTVDVCARQLKAVLPKVSDWSKMSIAYEPVRAIIRDLVGDKVANSLRILYGGSVNAKNCQELGAMPDVDGFLVGGASCKPEFTTIIQTAQTLYAS